MKVAEKLANDPLYVARAGRCSYYVDFAKEINDYSKGTDGQKVKEGANVWSSECRILPGYHMPCFDVDVDIEKVIMPTGFISERTVKTHVELFVRTLCRDSLESPDPGVEVRWVPSTSPGHHHVYVDYPVTWERYTAFLDCLATEGIVESGYVRVSKRRGGTYVRMPGVKKEFPPPDINLMDSPELLALIGDDEPF